MIKRTYKKLCSDQLVVTQKKNLIEQDLAETESLISCVVNQWLAELLLHVVICLKIIMIAIEIILLLII
jgi:hypothetical protein